MKYKTWAQEEINYLKKNYGKIPTREIMKNLKRSYKSINWKTYKLKLRSNLPNLNLKKLLSSSKKLTIDLAYILGVVLGDGNIYFFNNKKSSQIKLEVCDKDFAYTFKRILERWSGMKTTFHKRTINNKNHRDRYDVRLYSIECGLFLETFINTKINQILIASKKIQSNFLKGLYDSEGSIIIGKKYNRLKFSNTDYNLILLVKKLLENLTIKNIQIFRNYSEVKGNKKCYIVVIQNKGEINKFYNLVGCSIKRKQEIFKRIYDIVTKKKICKFCGKEIKEYLPFNIYHPECSQEAYKEKARECNKVYYKKNRLNPVLEVNNGI